MAANRIAPGCIGRSRELHAGVSTAAHRVLGDEGEGHIEVDEGDAKHENGEGKRGGDAGEDG